MRTRLGNITVTIDDELARWVRIEAARRDTSVSRFLAETLKTQMVEEDQYAAAMQRALARLVAAQIPAGFPA